MYVQLYQRYYDTFPNHLISQTISTLLQRIETRGINPVFTWYLPVHIHIHPNASVIKVHLHFPLSFHTFITLPSPALSPSTLAKQPLTPNTRGWIKFVVVFTHIHVVTIANDLKFHAKKLSSCSEQIGYKDWRKERFKLISGLNINCALKLRIKIPTLKVSFTLPRYKRSRLLLALYLPSMHASGYHMRVIMTRTCTFTSMYAPV